LNKFFISVLTKEPTQDLPMYTTPASSQILMDIHLEVKDTQEKLKNRKPNKSSGPDSINMNVLRKCLNLSPKDNLQSVYQKKGSRQKFSIYRPLSLKSKAINSWYA